MTNSHRSRFAEASITTVSPSGIIVMCFERIERDLTMAIAAMEGSDRATAHEMCCHAQEIINELLGSLDHSVWEHSGNLAALYSWTLSQLASANIRQDPSLVGDVRTVLGELREAFTAAVRTPAPQHQEALSHG